VASFIHAGALISGYAHHHARIAEGVIALVFLTAVAAIGIRPAGCSGTHTGKNAAWDPNYHTRKRLTKRLSVPSIKR
jgi:hypothetical protein